MERMEKAKATMMCLIEEEIKDFFENYEDREDAMRAWENVSHTLIAYMLLMHQDKNDFIKLLDDFYGAEEDDEDHQCLNCNETMSNDRWEAGKMCCDKPRFEGEESDEEEDE